MEFYDNSIKKDLFSTSYTTTYQNDFKKYSDISRTTYDYQKSRDEKPQKPSKAYEKEDHETFSKLRQDVHVPFELHVGGKPILHSDPQKPFEELPKIIDGSKEEAIKTRPRVFLLPAIPLDNIEDPTLRNILLDHTYTTEWRKMEREATANFKQIKPKIDKIETSDKVSLKLNLVTPLPEKFRKMGKDWDDNQLRGVPDPTREYWLRKEVENPVICGACVDPLKDVVPIDTKKTISKLINEEKLRYPHDIPQCTTYAGYRPMLPMGVPLEKKILPSEHPLLSVSQALYNRNAEKVDKI
ncbi:uncharacterized protein [Diabrotica undecimpunctata]|uniref:uncharacterized protein n=1 Tax=Diabrotica undecimpunctata TaxID=50387 RepID=UPI003B63D68D